MFLVSQHANAALEPSTGEFNGADMDCFPVWIIIDSFTFCLGRGSFPFRIPEWSWWDGGIFVSLTTSFTGGKSVTGGCTARAGLAYFTVLSCIVFIVQYRFDAAIG